MMILVLVMMPMFADDVDAVDVANDVDVYAQDCPTAAARSRCQFPGKLPQPSIKVKIQPKGRLCGVF